MLKTVIYTFIDQSNCPKQLFIDINGLVFKFCIAHVNCDVQSYSVTCASEHGTLAVRPNPVTGDEDDILLPLEEEVCTLSNLACDFAAGMPTIII